MTDIFESIKEKINLFTEDERTLLFALDNIHFEENPTDSSLIKYMNYLSSYRDADIVETAIEYLFKDKIISKDMQHYLIENFIVEDFYNIAFDKEVLKDAIDNGDISFENLPKKYKTDEILIYIYGQEDSEVDAWEIKYVFIRYVTQKFVAKNYDNMLISNKKLGSYMIGKARSKRMKTYLTLKFGGS